MIPITTGAPTTAVTELMLSSMGAKRVRAARSHPRQKMAPPKKQTGMTSRGREVYKNDRTRCGTAIPTKEIGPAKAVTQALSTLESSTSTTRNARMFTPMFCA